MNDQILQLQAPEDSRDPELVSSPVEESETDSALRAHGLLTGVNDYMILSELGAGAYGKVYLVKKSDNLGSQDCDVKFSAKLSLESDGNDVSDADEISTGTPSNSRSRRSSQSSEKKRPLSLGKGSMGGRLSITEDVIQDILGEVEENPSQANLYAMKVLQNRQVKRGNNAALINKEIAIMKRIRHPNLVNLIEVIKESVAPHNVFLVLEYVDYGQIMKMIDGSDADGQSPRFTCPLVGGMLGEAQASKMFCGVCQGMSYLHNAHIAHRDLKIDNILIMEDGTVKIADFGVSNIFEDEDNDGKVTDTKGTVPYWSPEMFNEDDNASYSSYKADVWAAGVCLFVLVFGVMPFWGDHDELYAQIIDGSYKVPTQKSPELISMIAAMLSTNADARPSFPECEKMEWITQHHDDAWRKLARKINQLGSFQLFDLDVGSAVTDGQVNLSNHVVQRLSNWKSKAGSKAKVRRNTLHAVHLDDLRRSMTLREDQLNEFDELEKDSSGNNDVSSENDSSIAKDTSNMKSPSIHSDSNSTAPPKGCNCIIA